MSVHKVATPSIERTLRFACLVLFCDAMAMGLVIPVLPRLIVELGHVSNTAAATVSGALLVAFASVQLLCSRVLGALSDRFGRRPIMLASLGAFSANYFIMAWAPSLTFLFVARVLSGVFSATYATANAAIADVASNEGRTKLFGLAGAAIGLGFVLGPTFGGLLGALGTRLPFLFAGALSLGACCYGWLQFAETRNAQTPPNSVARRANRLGAMAVFSRAPGIALFLMGLFCIHLSQQSYVSIWAFYTIEVANWSPLAIGLATAVYGGMVVVFQGLLAGAAAKRIGERRALIVGACAGISSYSMLAFASNSTAIFGALLVGGLGQIAFPAAQSMLTRAAPADAQGALQGAVAASASLSSVVGPLVMSQLFMAFSNAPGLHWPGAPFALAAVLLTLGAAAFALASRPAPVRPLARAVAKPDPLDTAHALAP